MDGGGWWPSFLMFEIVIIKDSKFPTHTTTKPRNLRSEIIYGAANFTNHVFQCYFVSRQKLGKPPDGGAVGLCLGVTCFLAL